MVTVPVAEWVEQWDHPDAPNHDEADRYAVYAVVYSGDPDVTGRRRLCATALDGIGSAILTMLRENEVPTGARIGVFDRLTRQWLVNPYA